MYSKTLLLGKSARMEDFVCIGVRRQEMTRDQYDDPKAVKAPAGCKNPESTQHARSYAVY